MTTEAQDIKKEIPKYLGAFAALVTLTLVTVGLSYLHLGWAVKIPVALAIACLQGAVVTCYSMRLISEKKTIFIVLILAVVLLLSMMLLILGSHFSVPQGVKFVS